MKNRRTTPQMSVHEFALLWFIAMVAIDLFLSRDDRPPK